MPSAIPEEVEAVGDPEDDDSEREEDPGSAELPAQERHDTDDECDQRQIAERIGEVRRDRERGAAGRLDDRSEESCGSGRSHGERADHSVEEREAGAIGATLRGGERRHTRHREWIEEQPEGVRDRRERHLGKIPEGDRVPRIGRSPRDQSHPDQRPRSPPATRVGAAQAERRTAEDGNERRVPAVDGLGEATEVAETCGALEQRTDERAGEEAASESLTSGHPPEYRYPAAGA